MDGQPRRNHTSRAELLIVPCLNGVFTIPEPIYSVLHELTKSEIVYLRQDEDALTISPVRLADGKRRQLHPQYRIQMFRYATRLAIIDLVEGIQVMPVQWRPDRRVRQQIEEES